MTKAQIKVFEDLLKSPDFKEKSTLDWVLWRNTTKPKFKVGDCYKVTDRGHRIYGYEVIDFKAEIVKISVWKHCKTYRYELKAICKCEGKKQIETSIFVDEDKIDGRKKCKDNENILGNAKDESADATIVRL
jgi:hypothetical protein